MRKSLAVIVFLIVVGLAGNARSVPILQVGAPGASEEGTYADYQKAPTLPSAGEETALTSGNILYVGGLVGGDTLHLGGGQYSADWTKAKKDSSSTVPTAFDGHGAILVASVPEGTLDLASLKINGTSAFYRSATDSHFPNNHDPLKAKTSDFLFFDIGDFSRSTAVPDFDEETERSAHGKGEGEIKTLTLSGMDSLAWIHFDVMALATDAKGKTKVVFNPGSHDVSWHPASNVSAPASITVLVPETATVFLLGLGLLGLYGYRLRRRRNA